MTTASAVKKGDLVFINYTGTYESGEVFDSTNGEPFYFIAGGGEIIEGFDSAVIGMKKGEKKDVIISPEKGYGKYDKERVVVAKRANFGEGFSPELNMQLSLELQDGKQAVATVIKFDDENVTLDLNHPLAGKTLKFALELVDIKDASEMPQHTCMGCCDSCGGCH